jgi:hypothetical protein
MLGMHKRQGDQSYADRAISIKVVFAISSGVMFDLIERFEKAWEVMADDGTRKAVETFDTFFLVLQFRTISYSSITITDSAADTMLTRVDALIKSFDVMTYLCPLIILRFKFEIAHLTSDSSTTKI